MSLKHAILGFLSYKSLSGYDLKKAFDRSIQHFWPANQSQIYRTLAELEESGFVEKQVIEREDRLDLKIYSITEAGRAELHRWLAVPLPEQDYREPFLIQVYFGGHLSDAELLRLVRHQIRELEERLEQYHALYRASLERFKSSEDPRAFFLGLLTLEYGIRNNQAALEWLKSAVERINTGDYTPATFE